MPTEIYTGDEHTYQQALAEMVDGSVWVAIGPQGSICYRLLDGVLQWYRPNDGWVTFDFSLATPPEIGWYRYVLGSRWGGP